MVPADGVDGEELEDDSLGSLSAKWNEGFQRWFPPIRYVTGGELEAEVGDQVDVRVNLRLALEHHAVEVVI